MTREEFVELFKKVKTEIFFDSRTIHNGGVRKIDNETWEVAFGVNLMPWINERIPAEVFENMTKKEATQLIKRMAKKLEEIKIDTIKFIQKKAKA